MASYIITVHESLIKKFRVEADSPAEAKGVFEGYEEDEVEEVEYDCTNYSVEEVKDEATGETFNPNDTDSVYCQNCHWEGKESALKAIQDLEQRVDPGETMPVGECPKCRALCHYNYDDYGGGS